MKADAILRSTTQPWHRKTCKQQEGERLTYEGVEGRVGADATHLVDGLEGQDVLLVLRATERAAGAAAGTEVPRGERH